VKDVVRDPALGIDLALVGTEDPVTEASHGGLERLFLVAQPKVHGRPGADARPGTKGYPGCRDAVREELL
jgi:hypothetical protein